MNTAHQERQLRIRALNDHARTTLSGALVVLSSSVSGLDETRKAAILARVSSFSDFRAENDPYGEHDMGFFEEGGDAFFFAFSYYDHLLENVSEDPSDLFRTTRVLTIGFAADY